jgi:3-phenylpropionate/trans-cinnamate dioxygenase ferredoxin reductase subunit
MAGLRLEAGAVFVDAHCRTSDENIYAAGDCTSFFSPHYERLTRLESVQNANDQARVAAANIAGRVSAYDVLPWFWSDQYDLKLQIAGLSQGYDEVVLRGRADTGRSFAAFYFAQGRLIAVDAVNRAKEFLLAKRLIAAKASPDRKVLGDDAADLKQLL